MAEHQLFDISVAAFIFGCITFTVGIMLSPELCSAKTRSQVTIAGFVLLCIAFGTIGKSRISIIEERKTCEASKN